MSAAASPPESTLTTPPTGLRRALFLDRDGILNEEIGYLYRPEDVRFVPGVFALMRTAVSLGYVLIVVTNQSGIARGLYSETDFEVLMAWMGDRLRDEGVSLAGVYHCPYHPEHGVGELRREHPDRKPSPGMLLRAARDHGIDLRRSGMIGDRCSDVTAANAAGLLHAMLLDSGPGSPGAAMCPGSYDRVRSLAEAEALLLRMG